MSNKGDLQRKLKDIGYELGSYASKDTLSNVIRLHALTVQNKGFDVAKLNDHDLRKNLIEYGLAVGPVTGHTRAIYQRKLLEALTNETTEGQEDIIETDLSVPTTPPPPPRTTRNSIFRTEEKSISSSSPGRTYTNDYQEPRIPLSRVEIDDRNTHSPSSHYPNLSNTKAKSDQIITHSYSPQRSSTKPEPRNSNISYGLRNPYDFQNDEPVVTPYEHKATPFRATNTSSSETFSSNTNRFTKQSDGQSTIRSDFTDIRSRILTNTNDQKDLKINPDISSKKAIVHHDSDLKKPEKLDVAVKNGGTFLYGGIVIVVALIVFVLYSWFEK